MDLDDEEEDYRVVGLAQLRVAALVKIYHAAWPQLRGATCASCTYTHIYEYLKTCIHTHMRG